MLSKTHLPRVRTRDGHSTTVDTSTCKAAASSVAPSLRIAVVGPDGAGKTSVVRALQARIPGSRVIYGGVNREYLLVTTSLGLRLWHLAQRSGTPGVARTVRFTVFYPLGYLENLARASAGKKGVAIYDRHPVDLMMMASEFRRLTLRPDVRGPQRTLRLLLSTYPLLLLLKAWYTRLYPRFDLLCFLLPGTDLLMERGNGQYSDLLHAEAKRQAYADMAQELGRRQRVLVVDVSRDMSLEAVVTRVMQGVESARSSQDMATTSHLVHDVGDPTVRRRRGLPSAAQAWSIVTRRPKTDRRLAR